MGKKSGGRVRVKQVGPKAPPVMNPMEALQIPPEEMIRLPPQPDRKYQVIWPIRKLSSSAVVGSLILFCCYNNRCLTCFESSFFVWRLES